MTATERALLYESLTGTVDIKITDPDGAPYASGDPISVQVNGIWQEAMVTIIVRVRDDRVRFGLKWLLRVDTTEWCIGAMCDDDGVCHRNGYKVRPSHDTSE